MVITGAAEGQHLDLINPPAISDLERPAAVSTALGDLNSDSETTVTIRSELIIHGGRMQSIVGQDELDLASEINSLRDHLFKAEVDLQRKEGRIAELVAELVAELDRANGEIADLKINRLPDAYARVREAEESAPAAAETPQRKLSFFSEDLVSDQRIAGRAHGVDELLEQAQAEFAAGNLENAEELYGQIIQREPDNATALSNLALILFEQDKLAAASVALEKAIDLAPQTSLPFTMLGVVRLRQGQNSTAVEFLEKAIEMNGADARAHNYLGIAEFEAGNPAAAAEQIRKAIELRENYADAHFNLAVVYALGQPVSPASASKHYHIARSLGASPDPALERQLVDVE